MDKGNIINDAARGGGEKPSRSKLPSRVNQRRLIKEILIALLDDRPKTARELAAKCEEGKGTITRWLRVLNEEGLVKKVGQQGQGALWTITPDGKKSVL